MSLEETLNRLNEYFADKLEKFGPTPEGVDYNGPEAQTIRFEQLVKIIDPSRPFTVLDYGCGYGAMFEFLQNKGWQFEYWGVDLVEKMVLAGREIYRQFPHAHFTTDENEVPGADYLLAGAIFNIKLETPYDEWRDFTLRTLDNMNRLCSKGFSFNMLTKYSDPERMAQRPDLYYGDPLFYFDYCKRHFARNVALLHDYGLYDFTILVRKDI
ncbi:MAG: methyltransferase domain-containing protein [Candidatus Villigracilaceae bacterium]